jgi:hypothetical protein
MRENEEEIQANFKSWEEKVNKSNGGLFMNKAEGGRDFKKFYSENAMFNACVNTSVIHGTPAEILIFDLCVIVEKRGKEIEELIKLIPNRSVLKVND